MSSVSWICTNPRTQFGCVRSDALHQDTLQQEDKQVKQYTLRQDCFDETPCGGDELDMKRVQMYSIFPGTGTKLFEAAVNNVREIKNVFQLMSDAIETKDIPLLTRILPALVSSKMYYPWVQEVHGEELAELLSMPDAFTDFRDYLKVVRDSGAEYIDKPKDVAQYLARIDKDSILSSSVETQDALGWLVGTLSKIETMTRDEALKDLIYSLIEMPLIFDILKSDYLGDTILNLVGNAVIQQDASLTNHLANSILTRSDNPETQDTFLGMVGEDLFGIPFLTQDQQT